MVDSVIYVMNRLFRKEFWLLFLVSLAIVLLVACRTEIRSKFYKIIEGALKN